MTQEEKKELLVALCGYLPYGLICAYEIGGDMGCEGILSSITKVKTIDAHIYWDCYFEDDDADYLIDVVKPYLRSISSMTDEEQQEYDELHQDIWDKLKDYKCNDLINWLNSHFFDYKELIEKGLALEAPEGMYKTD